MSKQEFLSTLETALRGGLSEREVAGQTAYYREYIEEQMRNGQSEAQIMEQLGDPRLIARTILETSGSDKSYNSQDYFYEQREENEPWEELEKDALAMKRKHIFHVAIGIFIAIAVLTLIIRILNFLVPILLPIILVMLILGYFKRKQ